MKRDNKGCTPNVPQDVEDWIGGSRGAMLHTNIEGHKQTPPPAQNNICGINI